MTRLLTLLYLPLVLLILPVSLHAQWAEVPGYDRRDILKMDTFQKRIFMLEDRGILYRSDNHGLSWKALKPGGTAMAQVECFAGAGNTLVAYSGTGIWRSEDLGDSWAFVLPASPSLPPQFTSLVSLNGQFYLSRTSGIMRIDLDAKQLVTLYNIAASQVRLFVSGNDIWATATQNTVHRSTDSGQTWVKYPGLFVGELAFLGDTVWALSGASKAVFLLKSDPTQQLHERALPAAAANASYRRLTAVNGKLYFSYVGQADVYVPATQGWQPVIPYWKNMRVNAIWSDGSFLFGLTTKGPARQNPVTGTWNLCNTGILFTEIPSFLQTGRYLFMYDDFGTGSPGGVLLPGPSPLWVTPHLLTTVSVSQTGNGYYAWDDSSRFWRSDPLLQEWTPVSTGPQLLSPYYYGRVFGQGDTLYSSRSDARLFRSLNGGQDWSLYCGLPSGAKWEQLLLTEGKEAYYIDEFKQVYSLNTKYNQGLWDKQGIVTGPGRKLAKEGSTLYAATPSGKISLSGDQGLTWTTWDVVSQSGVTISYRDFEVCEAGIFVIASNTAPPGQVYPGLFYAAEAGDKFERLSFPPFDTLVLGPETNKLSSIKYVDGYLYVSMSGGQIYRQAFKPGQVYAYSGTIWQDDNDNGQQDAGEKPLANVLVRRG
ncbi:MAG: hypothetical protein L6Q97_25385, partial [Thermoanaerobaculia bacterium]|nr:hypothetical protein [Thermoanaerobaculia bacterium]